MCASTPTCGAEAYVDRQITRSQPDVTIVAATAAWFAYPMVGGRLIKLLGWRRWTAIS